MNLENILIGILLYTGGSEEQWPPVVSECPDYWETTAEDTCVNTHKIGKCGLTAPYSFKGEIFKNQKTGDYSKCIWAKDCEVPWHNISNLC